MFNKYDYSKNLELKGEQIYIDVQGTFYRKNAIKSIVEHVVRLIYRGYNVMNLK